NLKNEPSSIAQVVGKKPDVAVVPGIQIVASAFKAVNLSGEAPVTTDPVTFCNLSPFSSIVLQRPFISVSILVNLLYPLVNSTLLALYTSFPYTKFTKTLKSNCLYLNCWLKPPTNFGLALPIIVLSLSSITPLSSISF